MVDTWFINALIMSGSIGTFMFLNKVIVEKKYNEAMMFVSFYFFVFIILTGLFFLNSDFLNISLTTLLFWIAWWIWDYLNFRTRIISLRHLPASMYFISMRLSSSLLLLMLGIFYFGDNISRMEFIWFILGFIVFALLFENEKMKDADYKKGILFLIISSLILVFLHFTIKESITLNLDLYWFLFVFWLTAFSLSVVSQFSKINLKVERLPQIIGVNIIQAILLITYFIFLLKTYSLWDLGISYKILSYSMFIPIIGSIVFFKEKITWMKALAFVLTIVSLWFFIN